MTEIVTLKIPPIMLTQLCQDIVTIAPEWDREIHGIAIDSRKVCPGDLFLATAGTQTDGRVYIDQAISNGAIAVLCESGPGFAKTVDLITRTGQNIPLFCVAQLSEQIGVIASRFYRSPSRDLFIIGVTGTNGKTSTSWFIANALTAAGKPCGMIGTIGTGFPSALQPAQLTTPDPLYLQQCLAQLRQQGATVAVVETSSHALMQGRVNGVFYDIAIFTNLTRDHLDYHGSLENYAQAKRRLFLQPGLRYAVINEDDEVGQQFINEFADSLTVYAYGLNNGAPQKDLPRVLGQHLQLTARGLQADVITPWGNGQLSTRLWGKFHLYNLLAALTCLALLEIPIEQALHYLSEVPGVCGRMEVFGDGINTPKVIVDFAHTPDALAQALQSARAHCNGKLWCVFGCGGDRDQGKRPEMGAIAEKLSDCVVVTNDNPRHEIAENIAQSILDGMNKKNEVKVELDRALAIRYALMTAKPNDVVLIAGKGHETYQQLGDSKHPFSDQKYVEEVLEGIGG